VMPTFYSRAGEEISVPRKFAEAVRQITQAVQCSGCFHCHYVRAPKKEKAGAPTADVGLKKARIVSKSSAPHHPDETSEHVDSPEPTSPDLHRKAASVAKVE
jgi:hypothetical protein